MTKKDYILIAQAIKSRRPSDTNPTKLVFDACVDSVMVAIADALQGDNPRFDKQRFIEACK